MKSLTTLFGVLFITLITSCNTSECHECHYEDENDQEVELGEYCDDELEAIEANGYNLNDTTYEVHCHEH